MALPTASPVETLPIEPKVQKVLADSPVCALRDLRVERHDDTLVITGSVNSFYHKQLAQEVVRTVANGLIVVNSVTVSPT